MPLKQISINQLKPGMFVQQMDISWLQSPFLRHHRKIKSEHDVLLLKKAGCKIIGINTDKGIDVSDSHTSTKVLTEEKKEQQPSSSGDEEDGVDNEDENEENLQITSLKEEVKNTLEKTNKEKNSLENELAVAKEIQSKIHRLVNQLEQNIKNGLAVNVKEVIPLINDSLKSIERNDQALLTMLHIYRKDKRLNAHAFATFSLSIMLALKANCSKSEIEIIAMAALLHDCGWSRLPLNLFGKGKRYTASEATLVKQHVPLVVSALKKSKTIDKNVIALVEQHHEHNNNTGYPNQLGKEQLHKLHNFLQIADLYDTYTHGLEDNSAVISVNALKILYKKSRNGWFKPERVTQLVQILGVYPINSVVKLTSDEIGVVVEMNRKLPLLPKVKVLLNEKGQEIANPMTLDLANDDLYRLVLKVLNHSALPNHLQQQK